MSQEAFGVNDLVICDKGNGKLVGGGFNLKGSMLAHAPITTEGGEKTMEGGSAIVSSLKGLAVPAGLLYLQKSMQEQYYEFDNKNTVVDDNLFDKLYKMAADDDSVSSASSKSSSKSTSKSTSKSRTRKKKSNNSKKSKKRGTRRSRK